MSAKYDKAFAETLMHIDSNYGVVWDGNGGTTVDLVESELLPSAGEPGFKVITAEYLAATLDRQMPGLLQRS